MASGGYFQGYGRGAGRAGGGFGDYGGGYFPESSFGEGGARRNPEFFHKERGYGYEGTRSSAIDPFDTPVAKRRKIDNVTICVDYVRGFCAKGSRCPKPHVDYVESIDEREIMAKLKFCHDFQNKGMCTRRDCKFLHVTRREEDEFLLTGTIPQAVFVRMREWTAQNDPEYRAFHGGGSPMPAYSPRGRAFGGGRGGMRGGMGSRSYGSPGGYFGGGRNSGNTAGGTGHSMNQPVTYGNFCIDFMKGSCSRSQNCPLKHTECVDDLDDRQGIIKQVFCHDYQNQNCQRLFCKYVHASRQEEEFFMENGYFPPTLNTRNRDKMFFSNICIDHLRSQCVRGNSCQYVHVDKVEPRNERICLSRSIFCHDFQEGGCSRPNCKLVHTGKPDEQHFLRTGQLPTYLAQGQSSVSLGTRSSFVGSREVCREFVKNQCNRGDRCRFYHPTPAELQELLNPAPKPVAAPSGNSGNPPPSAEESFDPEGDMSKEGIAKENEDLKARVQQLERLLADACHCITLAVGDQNPAIATLMKTIANMAPASALANQSGEGGEGGEGQADVAGVLGAGSAIPTVK